MIFTVGNTFDKVKNGTKTVTRRPYQKGDKFDHDGLHITRVYRNDRLQWEVGKDYAVQSGRGIAGDGRIRIVHLEIDPNPGRMSVEEAALEGFVHPDQFAAEWTELYGDDHLWRPAWRIEFEYLPAEDSPENPPEED